MADFSSKIFYPDAVANLAFTSGGRNDPSSLLKLPDIKPASFTVEHNNILTADTFKAAFDIALFPIDVSALESCVVDIYAGDVERLGSALERTVNNQLIIGHADSINVDMSNTSRPTVNLSGRDYSGFFLDQPWGNYRLELGRPLIDIITEIKNRFPATDGLEVVSNLPGTMPVIPRGKGRKGRYFSDKAAKTSWDVMHKLSRMVGVIVTMQGDTVVIQEPSNVNPADQVNYPVFIDALNITSLKIKRRFTTEDLPNIRVVARDPANGRRVVGDYPNPPNQTVKVRKTKTKVSRTVDRKYREYRSNHPAPTTAILTEVARRIYEGYRQQQMNLSFTTRDMKVPASRVNDDPQTVRELFPATSVRNGTAVRIYIARRLRRLIGLGQTAAQRAAIARDEGFVSQVAEELGRSWSELDKLFYVDKASHTFSQSGGYELSCACVNFLEV